MTYFRLNIGVIDVELAKKQMYRKDLAKEIGVNASNLSIALNRCTVRPVTAGKIAAALGVPVEEILMKGA